MRSGSRRAEKTSGEKASGPKFAAYSSVALPSVPQMAQQVA
jgi:hypothetical protein